jgi:hypothetical protein
MAVTIDMTQARDPKQRDFILRASPSATGPHASKQANSLYIGHWYNATLQILLYNTTARSLDPRLAGQDANGLWEELWARLEELANLESWGPGIPGFGAGWPGC